MNKLIIGLLYVLVTVGSAFDLSNITDKDWVQLFNGKDLEGWNSHFSGQEYNTDPKSTLKVEDGMLRVDYSGYDTWNGAFGHFARDEVYSHYIFAVEYRFIGDQTPGGPGWAFRNNGIMFHSEAMSEMEKNQDFPVSVEAQLLQRGTGEEPTAVINLCNGASRTRANESANCSQTDASVPIEHRDAWVRAEVLVLADSIAKFILNGDTLGVFTGFTYVDGGGPVTEGRIALQAETHPTDFRKIEIVNLVGCMDPEAANYREYYFIDDPASCIAEMEGCMDSAFLEYDADANTQPEGACVTPKVYGCTVLAYKEYNPEANMHNPELCLTGIPYPAGQIPYIRFDGNWIDIAVHEDGRHSVSVHDISGKIILKRTGSGARYYRLPIAGLHGVRFIVIETQSRVVRKKLLIL